MAGLVVSLGTSPSAADDFARGAHGAACSNRDFEHVNFVGRFDFTQPSAPACTWTYCGLEFDFRGTGVELKLSGAGHIQLYVVVDGQLVPTVTTQGAEWSTTDTPTRYMLASGLREGLHHFEVHRGPEGMFGAVRFHGIDIQRGHVVGSGRHHRRTLEVIGDSISAGYGNLVGVVPCEFGTAFEDGYMTYGAIAARLLDADVRIEAVSGIGMALALDGDTTFTMPNVWDNVNVFDSSVKYDCSTWKADAVVVNLGTNDFNAGVDPATYVATYVDYLQTIRDCYPKALILCAVNDANDEFSDALNTVIETYADPRVEKIDLGTPNWAGCDGHPDITGHVAMGKNLAARLRAELHW
jgi:lysophospholipase L1-like esterase